MKPPLDPAAHQQFAYGDAARRAFEMFVADLDPHLRHRLGQRSYHQLREVFTSGFEHGLSYREEIAPEDTA